MPFVESKVSYLEHRSPYSAIWVCHESVESCAWS